MYKVLWFDDEIEQFEVDIDTALQNNIEIIGFDNAIEGLKELKANLDLYDAIIVDGLFHKKPGSSTESLNQIAFGVVAKELFAFKNKGNFIPAFIYSGQKSFVKDKNDFVEVFKDASFATSRIYDKNIDEDFEELLNDIKNYSGDLESTLIRQKYADAFESLTDEYIGKQTALDFLHILKDVEKGVVNDHYNNLRKLVEDLFKAFHRFDLIPAKFITPKLCINETSKLLAGSTEKNVTLNRDSVVPDYIVNDLRSVLSITQPASHRSKTEKELKQTLNIYQLNTIVNHLCSTFVWFKIHIDSNPKQNNWVEIENTENDIGIEGVIEQDERGNYHCGNNIFQYTKIHNHYQLGTKIKISKVKENTSSLKEKYPNFVINFVTIDD